MAIKWMSATKQETHIKLGVDYFKESDHLDDLSTNEYETWKSNVSCTAINRSVAHMTQ